MHESVRVRVCLHKKASLAHEVPVDHQRLSRFGFPSRDILSPGAWGMEGPPFGIPILESLGIALSKQSMFWKPFQLMVHLRQTSLPMSLRRPMVTYFSDNQSPVVSRH